MALMRLGGYARIFALLQDIVALAEARQEQRRLGLAYRHLIDYFLNTGDPVRALDVGHRALALATSLDDVALQLSTRYVLARVYGEWGDYRQAVDICRHIVSTLADDVPPQLVNAVSRWDAHSSCGTLGRIIEAFVRHMTEHEELGQAPMCRHTSLRVSLYAPLLNSPPKAVVSTHALQHNTQHHNSVSMK